MEFIATVLRNSKLTESMCHLMLTKHEDFSFTPGEYGLVGFEDVRLQGKKPFTFCNTPSAAHLELAIKRIGEFSTELCSARPGDKLVVRGALPTELAFDATSGDTVFIAGGSGITPFLSALRYMRETGYNKRVMLFYANRTLDEVPFKQELDEHPFAHTVYVLSGEHREGFEHGYVDAQLLSRYIEEPQHWTYYVCGPPPMNRAVRESLASLNIPEEQIHQEQWEIAGSGGDE